MNLLAIAEGAEGVNDITAAQDADLLDGLRADDPAALAAVIDRYCDYVTGLIQRQLGSFSRAEDVEELAADTFFALWQHRHRLHTDHLHGWLASTARNRARSHLRRLRPAATLASGLSENEAQTRYTLVESDGPEGFYKVTLWNGATVSGSEFLFNGDVELLGETQSGPWQVISLRATLPNDPTGQTRHHLLCYHADYGCLVQLTGSVSLQTLEQMLAGLTVYETTLPAISSFTALTVLDGGMG